MAFLIGVLTVVLVLNCLLLVLLVLIQLPKKEAGAGLAFGGAATDALFGAGSGNALTKITKYATVIFLALTVMVGIMQNRLHRSATSDLEGRLQAGNVNPPGVPAPGPSPAPGVNTAPTGTPSTSSAPAQIDLPPPPASAPSAPEATPAPPKQ